MSVITAVAFDVMDTLLRDPFREALEAASGRPLRELLAVRDPSLYPALERGDIDEATYWAAHTRAGIEIDAAEFHRVRRAGTRWLPGMRGLVDELAGRVVRATASNYPVWIEELAGEYLTERMEHVVASCHLGVRKPDPGFFAGLVRVLDRPPGEVLFIDDREQNVEAARGCGLRAHLFTGSEAARACLVRHGVCPA